MSSAEDHRGWDDVEQHSEPPTLRDAAGASQRRRMERVAGGDRRERTLSRAHAAGFASAFDLDGAFGAPSRRGNVEFDDDGDRVIVLERGRSRGEHDDAGDEAWADEPRHAAPRRTLTLVTDDAPVEHEGRTHARGERMQPDTDEFAPRSARRRAEARGEIEPRRREPRSLGELFAFRPDRMGLYTVLLGLFLVVLAAASGGHT